MNGAETSIRPRSPGGPKVFFESASGRTGQRLYVYHRPAPAEGDRSLRGAVLYIHPFAEEMNKSRRMAALQSRALAEAGLAVLQIDLLGCGDSSGDFGDATWEDWLDDVGDAANWLLRCCPAPLWLWGLRAGCLLAAEAAARFDYPCHLLLWQPATAGKPVLQQFLRLKVAAQLADGVGSGVVREMKADLAAGKPVQVAGYRLHPRMASGLEAATLAPPAVSASGVSGAVRRLVWLEVSSQGQHGLSPVSSAALPGWARAGFAIDSAVVQGPTFWQTTEIEDAPALIDTSVRALLSGPVAG